MSAAALHPCPPGLANRSPGTLTVRPRTASGTTKVRSGTARATSGSASTARPRSGGNAPGTPPAPTTMGTPA
ncbi:hypothetical protein ACIBEJ_08285 [Nonomuraea sp. NPDC050790]|uniref:hypothetical protein n=1 Tax=Nonomuraea sp. NPDC050790 TaxID=3364371 RepID=UPI0037ABCF3F